MVCAARARAEARSACNAQVQLACITARTRTASTTPLAPALCGPMWPSPPSDPALALCTLVGACLVLGWLELEELWEARERGSLRRKRRVKCGVAMNFTVLPQTSSRHPVPALPLWLPAPPARVVLITPNKARSARSPRRGARRWRLF